MLGHVTRVPSEANVNGSETVLLPQHVSKALRICTSLSESKHLLAGVGINAHGHYSRVNIHHCPLVSIVFKVLELIMV